MLFLKGCIYTFSDLGLLLTTFKSNPNNKIVLLDDNISNDFILKTGAVEGSILLPPYEISSLLISGQMEQFKQNYFMYLSSEICSNFITVMIKALYNGNNILLYAPNDSKEMYFRYLAEYIFNAYGVLIGDENIQFNFDSRYIPYLLSSFYLMNLMSKDEFIIQYPANIEMNPDTMNKLCIESGIGPIKNIDMSKKYINNYISNCQQQNKVLKIIVKKEI